MSNSIFSTVLSLIDRQERRWAFLLLLPMVLTSLFEVLGIVFVMPFMAVVVNPNIIQQSHSLQMVYHFFHFQSDHYFLMFLGFSALMMLILGNSLSALTSWLMLRFSHLCGYSMATRLFANYLLRPYSFFLQNNSAALSNNILTEVMNVVLYVLVIGMELVARLCAVSCILALLLWINPSLALSVAVVVGSIYGSIYMLASKKLALISSESVELQQEKFKVTNEGFGGIKEVKLGSLEGEMVSRFAKTAEQYAKHQAASTVISVIPKYALETVAFGGILMIVLYLLSVNTNPASVVSLLALYAFAGYRLMPSIQFIFAGFSTLRSYQDALHILAKDLNTPVSKDLTPRNRISKLPLGSEIVFDQLAFEYPGAPQPVLHNVSLKIATNTTVAFVGATGAGKSTLVQILLGLLEPTSGGLFVDGVKIDQHNVRSWQANLGFVPQHIYLTDDTIARNIAFGLADADIDQAAVIRAAKTARLHDFIVSDLADGYATTVGERGVRLSGGQIQRIGIARALYHDPQVLVLDEATSSLDGITETAVMEAIHHLAHQKTLIIIAHRLSTVKPCDCIYLLDRGNIAASGNYETLMAQSQQFKQMAKTE